MMGGLILEIKNAISASDVVAPEHRTAMAPKKEPEPPPPPPPAPPPATSWEDEWESEEVVSSIVDELVVGAEEVLAQKALRAAVAP